MVLLSRQATKKAPGRSGGDRGLALESPPSVETAVSMCNQERPALRENRAPLPARKKNLASTLGLGGARPG